MRRGQGRDVAGRGRGDGGGRQGGGEIAVSSAANCVVDRAATPSVVSAAAWAVDIATI